MSIGDIGIIFSIASSVLGLVYYICNRLISMYYAKADELEKIKEKRINTELTQIKMVMRELKDSLMSTDIKIRELQHTLKSNDEGYKRVLAALNDFSKTTIKRIEAIEAGEMVPIGGGKFIFKKGK
jgi:ABC-type oligopeptide transport system ATPase subunit